jgi:hypothetical protein
MASGLPVVAADIPVFREVGGEAAFYADPHKADALASAMEEALYVPAARSALCRRGFERIQGFTWERTAQRLSALLDEVIEERSARRREWIRVPQLPAPRRRRPAPAFALGSVEARGRAA